MWSPSRWPIRPQIARRIHGPHLVAIRRRRRPPAVAVGRPARRRNLRERRAPRPRAALHPIPRHPHVVGRRRQLRFTCVLVGAVAVSSPAPSAPCVSHSLPPPASSCPPESPPPSAPGCRPAPRRSPRKYSAPAAIFPFCAPCSSSSTAPHPWFGAPFRDVQPQRCPVYAPANLHVFSGSAVLPITFCPLSVTLTQTFGRSARPAPPYYLSPRLAPSPSCPGSDGRRLIQASSVMPAGSSPSGPPRHKPAPLKNSPLPYFPCWSTSRLERPRVAVARGIRLVFPLPSRIRTPLPAGRLAGVVASRGIRFAPQVPAASAARTGSCNWCSPVTPVSLYFAPPASRSAGSRAARPGIAPPGTPSPPRCPSRRPAQIDLRAPRRRRAQPAGAVGARPPCRRRRTRRIRVAPRFPAASAARTR